MSYNRRTLAPDSPFAVAAAVIMILSAAFLTVYYVINSFEAVRIPDYPAIEIITLYILPVGCCVIMSVMLLTRMNNLMPTIIPMLFGVGFFAFRAAFTLKPLHCILCCVLYAGFASIYVLTVSGFLNSRGLLMAVSGLPLAYHLLVEDLFITKFDGFVDFLPELSVLLIMLSLFVETLGMRRGRLYS